jgi:hypothetical protein
MPSASEPWTQLDHHLVNLEMQDVGAELRAKIAEEVSQIYWRNRGNLNSGSVHFAILQMHLSKMEEWATEEYSVCCHVWEEQGKLKSPAFLRAVFQRGIVPLIHARKDAVITELKDLAARTNFSANSLSYQIRSFELSVGRLEDKWRRKVEKEARRIELAEARVSGSTPREQRSGAPVTVEQVSKQNEKHLADGSVGPTQTEGSRNSLNRSAQEFIHSDDYRSLWWNGAQFALSPGQAHVVQMLNEAGMNGTPDLGNAYILEQLERNNSRLRDTFKNSPLWNTLVISRKKGTRRLSCLGRTQGPSR